MKANSMLLLAAFSLLFSCSTDKDNVMIDESNLTGRWDATELRIDESTATDDERNAKDFLDYLTARDCYVITLQFNEDLSVLTESSLNYIEVNVNSEGTGIEIPCPQQEDVYDATYSFDGRVLTITEPDGTTTEAAITLDGNMLLLDASTLEIPQFTGSGQLVFIRQ